jgi:Ala-tRNA(Pro) deacylase
MSIPCWLRQILRHYSIPYTVHHHAPAATAAHLAEAEHISGYRVAKTVFLWDHGRPLAVVIPSCRRLDVARVQTLLGQPDLRLASEAEVVGWFKGCQPGAVPPFRLRDDERILMDRALAHLGTVLFPAGTLEAAVSLRFRDWYRAVRPGIGRLTEAGNGRAHANGNGTKPTVLVVEDEAATNNLFCRLLERSGLHCLGVEEGKRALELAPQLKPAAILLDLMLPDISGYEMYAELRRSGPLKRIPVIVVSALDDPATRERGRQLGADAYLTKPFEPAKLVAEMLGVIEES